jgi:hypothetical protein
LNGNADVLMKRLGNLPEVGDKRLKYLEQVFLNP